jgi:hypothetical protein
MPLLSSEAPDLERGLAILRIGMAPQAMSTGEDVSSRAPRHGSAWPERVGV